MCLLLRRLCAVLFCGDLAIRAVRRLISTVLVGRFFSGRQVFVIHGSPVQTAFLSTLRFINPKEGVCYVKELADQYGFSLALEDGEDADHIQLYCSQALVQ
jgi:hypothetical protein